MTAILTSVRGVLGETSTKAMRELERYRRYRKTYAELSELPTDALLDLDLYRGDLRQVARDAAYAH